MLMFLFCMLVPIVGLVVTWPNRASDTNFSAVWLSCLIAFPIIFLADFLLGVI